MWKGPQRRLLSRPRFSVYLGLASLLVCLVLFKSHAAVQRVVLADAGIDLKGTPLGHDGRKSNSARKEAERKARFLRDYEELGRKAGAGAIYKSTLATLIEKESRTAEQESFLTISNDTFIFSFDKPFTFRPFPKYDHPDWKASHPEHATCLGPAGMELRDIAVFKGHSHDFPAPSFGSHKLLDIDPNLCFERETRLGPYGLRHVVDQDGEALNWDTVNWGELQEACINKNAARFDQNKETNKLVSHYQSSDYEKSESLPTAFGDDNEAADLRRGEWSDKHRRARGLEGPNTKPASELESRTAILLRSYTGRQYSDNDKHVIRSLITELNLHTGGEFQVFLFLHVRTTLDILADKDLYEAVLEQEVPREFWNMTVLWSDGNVLQMYPSLDPAKATVADAQWLSVQKFVQDHREFDFVWNWEMDTRITGHHYDMLTKLAKFAKKQPRKGLWERNERFYIPEVHGDYDTHFRREVEKRSGDHSVWGPPKLPFIRPIGPRPPMAAPEDDDYAWGVGEEADLITLSPIFDPVNSSWILANQVWGYSDERHSPEMLPRRTSIVTHSRLSRKLLDIMHVENLRGNHVGSEMAPQTVALLHGLKAVYAPAPVYFDRPWDGRRLAKWFNGGPRGASGGTGSAMGWGREGRFRGSTWYYRADPPQRLYNNWMGYEDTGIGGREWEEVHGRPCLPAMFLHPIKAVEPTEKGHSSKSKLPYT